MSDERKDRRNISLSISGEVDYRVDGSLRPPVTVCFSELSVAGINFVTTEQLSQGTVLNLAIRLSAVTDPIRADGEILWQRRISSRFLYRTCIKFTRVEEQQEGRLLQYIREYSQWKIVDREHARCGLNAEISCTRGGGGEVPEEFSCVSADIGLKGMKLLTDEALNIGQNISLVFSLPNVQEKLSCAAQVAWKRSGANSCVGVSFLELSGQHAKQIKSFMDDVFLGRNGPNEPENV